MRTVILGISAYYHDSAAALLIDGEIIAAAQEERFSRIKHDASFPERAVKYVLEEAGLSFSDLSMIAFYEKPLLKFERLLETYHALAPKGLTSFIRAIPVWLKEKLFIKNDLKKRLNLSGRKDIRIVFPEHHLSHAASAYYPSPFEEAAILTLDGVGEWATTTICRGTGNEIEVLAEQHFPHSLGLLYSAFTYYLGFTVNGGEYKLMGLAPYGMPGDEQVSRFKQVILSTLVDVREDGSILLNMDYFDFATRLRMCNNRKWEVLFGFPRREPESQILPTHFNLAMAIQEITSSIMVQLARTARKLTGLKNLVMAGGVALNCVANREIAAAAIFENIWIQPAAGDAGAALGAALAAAFTGSETKKRCVLPDMMKGSYLGPAYSEKDYRNLIARVDAVNHFFNGFSELSIAVSSLLADGKVVGWFQGRMEFGPRALGNRSILADPRNPSMQEFINTRIKSREDFRPFAPAVLEEDAADYFEIKQASPYMLFTALLKREQRKAAPDKAEGSLGQRLNSVRADVPAVIHVDYSARVQTVNRESNPRFWQLLSDFKKITGCGMLINTSFNIRDEPIVCSPEDAYRDFLATEMDHLVLGNFLLSKN